MYPLCKSASARLIQRLNISEGTPIEQQVQERFTNTVISNVAKKVELELKDILGMKFQNLLAFNKSVNIARLKNDNALTAKQACLTKASAEINFEA